MCIRQMCQIIPLNNDIYLCPYISITFLKILNFLNSVKNVVHSFPFSFKNLEVHRRVLLSLKHMSVFSFHFFEYFPF